MKRFLATLALALAAFVAGFILVTGLVYAAWYVKSWGYIHSPRLSPSDPHDAAAMLLLGLEMFVGLPGGMNGRQLADQARASRNDLKVLFTTGYARNAIVHHGRLDAGVELITKPFTYADLAAKVRDVLDKRPADS